MGPIVWNNLKLQAKYPIQFVSILQVSSWRIKLIRRTRKYRINLRKLDLTFIKKSFRREVFFCLSDFIVDSRHYLFKMNKVNTIIEHFSGRISIIFSIIQFSEKKTERNVRLQISAPLLSTAQSELLQRKMRISWLFCNRTFSGTFALFGTEIDKML